MNISHTKVIMLMSFLLCLSACSRDFDPPPALGALVGKVKYNSTPAQYLTAATIRLVECGLSAVSNAAGYFQIDDVPQGDYTLLITATIMPEGKKTLIVYEAENPVAVRQGVRDLGDISVLPSGWIEGRVELSDGGSPLNAVIYLLEGVSLTHASVGGGFLMSGVPAGDRLVGAALPGYMLAAPERVKIEPGKTTESIVLRLQPVPEDAKGNVSGSVLLGNPSDRAGVLVSLTDRFESRQYTAKTDEKGSYAFLELPAGYYQMTASHTGYRTVGLPSLEIRKQADLTLRTLTLPTMEGSSILRPIDSDPNGNLDDDLDGIADLQDNCPIIPNPMQLDTDRDGIGNACDPDGDPLDKDRDGVLDSEDNCPSVFNNGQKNHDDDPLGDACDPDDDNDGILDGSDNCPLVANPDQNSDICNWPKPLIYSAQDPGGDIHLYAYQPNHATLDPPRQLTKGMQGEAWGAWAVYDLSETWVFFHHRQSPGTPFRIYMLGLSDPKPEALPLGESDVMNPSVCVDPYMGTLMMFYEVFELDRWKVYSAADPDWTPGQNPAFGPGTEIPINITTPTDRAYSFRYPYCYSNMGGSLYLAFSADFDAGTTNDSYPLQWVSYVHMLSSSSTRTVGWSEPIYEIKDTNTTGGEVKRPSMGTSTDIWYVDRETGTRTDIMIFSGLNGLKDLVVNGARNLDPAMYATGAGTGLLAYQSDVSGSHDIYVLSVESGDLMRVTSEEGWAGSPTWVMDLGLLPPDGG